MRHKVKGRKLNRTASHKKALIRNLANQVFEHKEIKTTTAKAKEARITVERLITYAKKGDTHHRRLAFSFLRQKETIKSLFDEIAPTFAERQGGYTRVIKLGRRQGDGASMAILQLVGYETLADTSKSEKKKRTKNKEEKSKEKKVEAVEKKDSISEETQTEVIEKAPEEPKEIAEEKLPEEVKPVKDSEQTEEKEPVRDEEQVEEKKPEQEVIQTEKENPIQDEVKEEPEEAKTEDSKPEEDKKNKIE
jgi:large subunit ribosomal protein L17